MAIAQILMVITLLLMISGKTPFSMIVFIGTAIAAVVAGFPLTGGKDVVTITSFVVSGLNPVIADMAGVLMFIGMLMGFTQPVITAVITGIAFVLGYPIFLIGVAAAILTIILSKTAFAEGEAAMLQGVGRVATPLVATIFPDVKPQKRYAPLASDPPPSPTTPARKATADGRFIQVQVN